MQIRELSASVVRIRLRKAIKHASHSRTETDNLVVRCVLDNGVVGYGEGVPRDYVTGETAERGLECLQAAELARQLPAVTDFAAAVRQIEGLTLPQAASDERQIGSNAVRCAVELAYLDAAGRAFAEPLASVTRLLAPELYAPQPAIRYSGVITSSEGWKLGLRAGMMRVYGFPAVKVKVGIAGQDDPARLRRVRRWLRAKTDLRVDANEAYSVREAADRIAALLPYRISCVEQPLRHEDSDALPGLRRAVSVPIMLDESLCGMVDAKRAVAADWCDAFNLRLSKVGGFIAALRLAQFCQQHGLFYQLGCQVGETAILSAAGRAFGCSVASIRYLEGSYDRHLVRDALGRRDITFGFGGRAPALDGPGLGVEIDPLAVERVTTRQVRLI